MGREARHDRAPGRRITPLTADVYRLHAPNRETRPRNIGSEYRARTGIEGLTRYDVAMPYRRRLLDAVLDEVLAELPAILVVGPRAAGKTTTAERRSSSKFRLDVPAEANTFRADPDAVLRGLPEPVLLDEWQAVPEVFPAVKRAVDDDARPGRFLLTGSAYGDIEGATAAGTGRIVRLLLFGMTIREQTGQLAGEPVLDRLARGDAIETPSDRFDLRDYLDRALRSGFPDAVVLDTASARQRWLDGYATQITTRHSSGSPDGGGGARGRRGGHRESTPKKKRLFHFLVLRSTSWTSSAPWNP